jgi:isoquinoline 1-oxidoreductase alpha subunit
MIEFTLNGQKVRSEADSTTPLLWVIRDELGLKGTKYGCGIAQCGACTVHVGGQAVRSCALPVANVAGQSVTTIEGLTAGGSHPLQIAWVEKQVPQCGYCQSGQIMQAAELLGRNSSPSEQQVVEHMNGNLCRCMAYTRIKQAVLRGAEIARGEQSNG